MIFADSLPDYVRNFVSRVKRTDFIAPISTSVHARVCLSVSRDLSSMVHVVYDRLYEAYTASIGRGVIAFPFRTKYDFYELIRGKAKYRAPVYHAGSGKSPGGVYCAADVVDPSNEALEGMDEVRRQYYAISHLCSAALSEGEYQCWHPY